IGGTSAGWEFEDDPESSGQIVGRDNPALAGMFRERLLRYHRPLKEGGSIEYDYFYSPGSKEVHPAFDRLAFLLEPQGVSLHWLTDSPFDRTDVAPDHRIA